MVVRPLASRRNKLASVVGQCRSKLASVVGQSKQKTKNANKETNGTVLGSAAEVVQCLSSVARQSKANLSIGLPVIPVPYSASPVPVSVPSSLSRHGVVFDGRSRTADSGTFQNQSERGGSHQAPRSRAERRAIAVHVAA